MHHFMASLPKGLLTPPKETSSHIFKMALFPKFFGSSMKHIIRLNAGKKQNCFLNFTLVTILNIILCFSFRNRVYLDKFCYFSTDHFKIQTQKVTCNWPAFYSFYWRIKNFNCGVCSLSLKLWLMFSTNLVKFNFATFRNSCSNYLIKVLVS